MAPIRSGPFVCFAVPLAAAAGSRSSAPRRRARREGATPSRNRKQARRDPHAGSSCATAWRRRTSVATRTPTAASRRRPRSTPTRPRSTAAARRSTDEATTLDRTSEDAVERLQRQGRSSATGRSTPTRRRSPPTTPKPSACSRAQGRVREGVREPALRRPRPERHPAQEMTNPLLAPWTGALRPAAVRRGPRRALRAGLRGGDARASRRDRRARRQRATRRPSTTRSPRSIAPGGCSSASARCSTT